MAKWLLEQPWRLQFVLITLLCVALRTIGLAWSDPKEVQEYKTLVVYIDAIVAVPYLFWGALNVKWPKRSFEAVEGKSKLTIAASLLASALYFYIIT